MPLVRVRRHVARLVTRLVIDYFTYAARPVASAHHATCRVTRRRLLRLAYARRRLLRLRCASGCLGMSCGSSRGSSSTTSTMPRVRVPRHVARLITRLVAPLVVDYFAYVARPGASAHRAARHRLLHLCRASGCFGTSHGLSRDSSSTTSPLAGSTSTTSPTPRVRVPRHVAWLVTRLVVDYFTYAARPVASACCEACRVTRRRQLRLAQARRRLLHLRRASECLDTSRDSSRGSSSKTSTTSHVRVPRHVVRLITRLVAPLVVDYFAYAARPGASARRTARR
jgi:hypothetical protein